jgi:hypothetical protein
MGIPKEQEELRVIVGQILARAEKKGPIADKEPIGQGIHLIDDHWIVVSGPMKRKGPFLIISEL